MKVKWIDKEASIMLNNTDISRFFMFPHKEPPERFYPEKLSCLGIEQLPQKTDLIQCNPIMPFRYVEKFEDGSVSVDVERVLYDINDYVKNTNKCYSREDGSIWITAEDLKENVIVKSEESIRKWLKEKNYVAKYDYFIRENDGSEFCFSFDYCNHHPKLGLWHIDWLEIKQEESEVYDRLVSEKEEKQLDPADYVDNKAYYNCYKRLFYNGADYKDNVYFKPKKNSCK